jgi:hypothetical protein
MCIADSFKLMIESISALSKTVKNLFSDHSLYQFLLVQMWLDADSDRQLKIKWSKLLTLSIGVTLSANFEKISSMFKITRSVGESERPDLDNFGINPTASVWIWWWYAYFKENKDYQAYCEARRMDDDTSCEELENRFERISDLYSDWGDIHAIRPMHRNENGWKKWLYNHRHMFFVDVPAVKHVKSPVEIDKGSIAVQIPAALSKEEVLRLLEEFVDQSYKESDTVPEPKYQLHAPEGRIDQSTFQSVKKAMYIQRMAAYPKRRQHNNAEVALEVMSLELKSRLGFKWKLAPDQEERLKAGSLSMLELDSDKRQVGRFKANYAAYVANTIHGIFPKNKI